MSIKYRRTYIRIITVALALAAVSAGLFSREMSRANDYKRQLEYAYEGSFAAMVDHVANIEAAMLKAQYTNSPAQMVALSSQVWRESGSAISELARLPMSGQNVGAIAKYLTQTGDYVYQLARKVVLDQEITPEERDTLKKLSDYSRQVADHLVVMQSDHSEGRLSLSGGGAPESEIPSLADGLVRLQEGFDGFPTLIYDGPFSDHIEKRESALLSALPEVSVDDARAAAALYAGIDKQSLQFSDDGMGVIPEHTFAADGVSVDITARGGLLLGLINSRAVGEAAITPDEAIQAAAAYLEDHGFAGMTYSYYAEQGGIVTVNFAYTQGEVIMYPDLIKVGVALDDGSIVSVDTAGYMMSHKDTRELPCPALTLEQAQALLSSALTVEKGRTAIIPTDGGGEALCFEFLCKGQDGRDCLVYINALSGVEERILILLKSDGGVLTF